MDMQSCGMPADEPTETADAGPYGPAGLPLSPARLPVAQHSDADTDESLMARIAGGDQAAFGRLVDRHVDRALRLAQRMLGSRADAEDMVQEVFLKIWRKAESWRSGRGAFTTWLWRVVVNQCLDFKRKPRGVPLDDVAEPMDETPDQETVLATAQQEHLVAAAMATLPERQQAALALIYGAGASNAEAAESLGVSIGAIEQLLVRARRSLRAQLVEVEG